MSPYPGMESSSSAVISCLQAISRHRTQPAPPVILGGDQHFQASRGGVRTVPPHMQRLPCRSRRTVPPAPGTAGAPWRRSQRGSAAATYPRRPGGGLWSRCRRPRGSRRQLSCRLPAQASQLTAISLSLTSASSASHHHLWPFPQLFVKKPLRRKKLREKGKPQRKEKEGSNL